MSTPKDFESFRKYLCLTWHDIQGFKSQSHHDL